MKAELAMVTTLWKIEPIFYFQKDLLNLSSVDELQDFLRCFYGSAWYGRYCFSQSIFGLIPVTDQLGALHVKN